MVVVEYQRGVHLPEAGLWLDPRDPREMAFISHAHSDHIGFHKRILCSPATARFMQVRVGLDARVFQTLAFGEIGAFDGWSVKLLPAGHILGSSQLFYESGRGDLLYTGDFKLRKSLSSEGAVTTHAETLVMETTYGLPRYQFPPVSQTLEAVVKFCMEALEDGETPVLLGYALGKAQEILAALQGVKLPVMVHGSIARMAKVYEEFGSAFPPYAEFEAATAAGHVLICPPSVNGSRMLRSLRGRVAALTGWAMDPGAAHRLQVDAAFPLSDHADYGDLLQYVQAVRPDRVLTLHGFAQEFARDLRERGVEAWSLTGANQLEFSISMPASPAAPKFSPDPDGPGEDFGFNRFCQVCQVVRGSTGKLDKVRRLAEYLCSLDVRELPLAAVWLTGRPFAQRDPHPLNLGGAVIWRALLSASGLSERTNSARLLASTMIAG